MITSLGGSVDGAAWFDWIEQLFFTPVFFALFVLLTGIPVGGMILLAILGNLSKE